LFIGIFHNKKKKKKSSDPNLAHTSHLDELLELLDGGAELCRDESLFGALVLRLAVQRCLHEQSERF
jgi:hypothetical protein